MSNQMISKRISSIFYIWLLSSLCLFTACVHELGAPWGEITELQFQSQWEIANDREYQQRGIKTSTGYLIESFSLKITFDELSIFKEAAGSTNQASFSTQQAFDPSNPPAGCTLCHGGHCHCGGDLISYEDLSKQGLAQSNDQIEISLNSKTHRLSLELTQLLDIDVDEAMNQEAISFGQQSSSEESCRLSSCQLDQGIYSAVKLGIKNIELSMVVSDLLEGERQRLSTPLDLTIRSDESTRITLSLDEPLNLPKSSSLSAPPTELYLSTAVRLNADFFDIDWSNISNSDDVHEQIKASLFDLLKSDLNPIN